MTAYECSFRVSKLSFVLTGEGPAVDLEAPVLPRGPTATGGLVSSPCPV